MQILTDQSQARMPEGAYWVDFASKLFPTSIVRAVLFVRHEENCTTFRRLTGQAEKPGSWWGRFRGCHEGIVVERRGTYFFSGINTIGVREPSLLVVKPAAGHDFVLIGSATVMGTNGPSIMPVAISQAKRGESLLKIVRQARSFEISTPDIPTHILDLLNQQSQEMVESSPSALGGQLLSAS